jgi:transcriptional regulator
MYIPKINEASDREEILSFMRQFSFATIITAKDGHPVVTHLPFIMKNVNEGIVLASHFAKANRQWNDTEENTVLIIFSEPHAYISPKHFEKELNVPTWNYISVHAYGKGKLLTGVDFNRMFTIVNA